MERVLCNTHKLNEPWLISYLNEYLKKDTKVLYFILDAGSSYNDEMLLLEDTFREGERAYEELVMPLEAYGIKRKNINFSFLHESSLESLKDNISNYDVVIVYGNNTIYEVEELLYEALNNFKGLYIGINEGALLALEEYHHFEDEYERLYGLGLLSGFTIDVLYKERAGHLENIIRYIEENDSSIVAFSDNGGGIIIGEGYMELLGEAFILGDDNLDELYGALETLRMW